MDRTELRLTSDRAIAVSDADLATIAQGIYKDVPFAGGNRPGAILPGAFSRQGLLWLPSDTRSSPLVVRTGDWVAVDSYGDVFLIPRRALPTTLTGSVTLASGSSVVASATDITSYGWQVGTHVASSHTPAGSVIGSIAPGGLSFTLPTMTASAPHANALQISPPVAMPPSVIIGMYLFFFL